MPSSLSRVPPDTACDDLGRMAASLPHPPVSVIIVGSFARREAGPDSDIDVVVVRPPVIDKSVLWSGRRDSNPRPSPLQ
jgi:hypothetical protein